MSGLGLSIADLTTRRVGVAVPVFAITNMVIEGDSQTSTTPDQPSNRDAFYSYTYADDPANAGVTFHVRAQASRTLGGTTAGGADDGTPTGNTLLAHRADDLAYGAQLMTVMLGSNDFAAFSVDNTMTKWLAYAPAVRAGGTRIAVVAPPPYHPANPSYATFNPRWSDYIDRLRTPATRAAFADYYIPLGEHPDFRDPATRDAMINASDLIHLTPGASTITSGQYRACQIYKAAVDTIRDPARANATAMYGAAWPSSETNLAPGTTITRRIMVKGIAHAGLITGANVSGPAGTTIALNGGTAGSSVGTGSGNGWAIYNGDILDVTIPLSALNSTAVSIDLTIGGETRTLSYTTTANVTPASYAHQDVVNVQPAGDVHSFTGLAFDSVGVGLLAIYSPGGTPTGLSVGGVSATRRVTQTTAFNGQMSVWTVAISASGARDVVATFPGFAAQSTLSWGVVRNADAAIQQLSPASDGAAPANEDTPHPTGSVTVPANGIAVAFFGEYGGASITPATAGSGTTLIDEGNGTYQGETYGLAVGTRSTSGAASFGFAFGTFPRAAVVFKAAGT